jgi:hypothetical protein
VSDPVEPGAESEALHEEQGVAGQYPRPAAREASNPEAAVTPTPEDVKPGMEVEATAAPEFYCPPAEQHPVELPADVLPDVQPTECLPPEPLTSEILPPEPRPVEISTPEPSPPGILAVVDVFDLNWQAIEAAAKAPSVLVELQSIVEDLEALLDRPDGLHMLFDADRSAPDDRALKVSAPEMPLWIIGDLHGDLLALEAALALLERESLRAKAPGGIIFLGDLFDDEGMGLAVLLRIYDLILRAPERICLVVGNHDEALGAVDGRFTSSVDPADFTEFLNAHLDNEWIMRAGQLAVRLFARAPRALFFPDRLLVAHGGFPLSDLHAQLAETGNWNDPQALSDFVWTRAHPKARKKLPNRHTRGSQFGYEDFAAFCALSAQLERPITHMVRGHDHVEDRYAIYAADRSHPVLTTNALSRRLPREGTGTYARVPSITLYVEGAVPQVHRLHIPPSAIQTIYPEHLSDEEQNA